MRFIEKKANPLFAKSKSVYTFATRFGGGGCSLRGLIGSDFRGFWSEENGDEGPLKKK